MDMSFEVVPGVLVKIEATERERAYGFLNLVADKKGSLAWAQNS
jgi:hypothetical protein